MSRKELQNLTDLHREILMQHFMGVKGASIAQSLQITPGTVSAIVHSPMGEKMLERMRKTKIAKAQEITGELHIIAHENVEMVGELIKEGKIRRILVDDVGEKVVFDKASPGLRMKVYFDVLDRIGLGPVKNINARVSGGIVNTFEALQEIKEPLEAEILEDVEEVT